MPSWFRIRIDNQEDTKGTKKKSESDAVEGGEGVVGFGEGVEVHVVAAGFVALPEGVDLGQFVGAIDRGLVDPFGDIEDRAVGGPHRDVGPVGGETQRAQQRQAVGNDLQLLGFAVGFGFEGGDENARHDDRSN